ncbi:MAG TPA: hypothetical protein VF756_07935 [Thermoanaerobaculia bacterium]
MPRRTAERGEGNLGCILWSLALAVTVLICWKAIPVKVSSSELADYMDELARYHAARATGDELEAKILARAFELKLPVDKDHVQVERQGDHVRMIVEYTVPLDFPGYTYEWHFRHELDRPIFIV